MVGKAYYVGIQIDPEKSRLCLLGFPLPGTHRVFLLKGWKPIRPHGSLAPATTDCTMGLIHSDLGCLERKPSISMHRRGWRIPKRHHNLKPADSRGFPKRQGHDWTGRLSTHKSSRVTSRKIILTEILWNTAYNCTGLSWESGHNCFWDWRGFVVVVAGANCIYPIFIIRGCPDKTPVLGTHNQSCTMASDINSNLYVNKEIIRAIAISKHRHMLLYF